MFIQMRMKMMLTLEILEVIKAIKKAKPMTKLV